MKINRNCSKKDLKVFKIVKNGSFFLPDSFITCIAFHRPRSKANKRNFASILQHDFLFSNFKHLKFSDLKNKWVRKLELNLCGKLRPPYKCAAGKLLFIFDKRLWRCGGLNPGPFTCKANALPLSYIPRRWGHGDFQYNSWRNYILEFGIYLQLYYSWKNLFRNHH